ncbi:sigma-70 family RNA polymerase sigma factor [Candidatus Hydrogenedentota bacterium]
MNDNELLRRILGGEERLFSEIVERYAGRVWALCLSYVHYRSECEDVVQEVFAQCYERLDTLRDFNAFGGWLARLARRRCLMWLRAKASRDAAMKRYGDHAERRHAESTGDARDGLQRDELMEGVYSKIAGLPPKCREAFYLYYCEDNSQAEIADFLGIKADAVKKRLKYGRELLKKELLGTIEPTMAGRRRKEDLTRNILAAVPFGHVSWLAKTGSAATTLSKSTLIGGTIMGKKITIATGAILLLLLFTYTAGHFGKGDDEGVPIKQIKIVEKGGEQTPPMQEPETVFEETTPVEAEPEQKEAPPLPGPAPTMTPEAPEEEEKATETASISGRVTDIQVEPIANAEILLQISEDKYGFIPLALYIGTSSADGAYAIEDVETFGNGRIFVSAEGYVMKTSGGWLNIAVPAGMKRDDINVIIGKVDHFIAGRVVSEDGQPIIGARVDVHDGGSVTKRHCVVTDQDGDFRASCTLAYGEERWFDFKVSKPGYGTAFFPQVEIDADDSVLVLYKAGSISGKVTTTAGKGLEGVGVEVLGEATYTSMASHMRERRTLHGPLTTATDADGNYSVGNLSGDFAYIVAARRHGRADIRGEWVRLLKSEEGPALKKDVRVNAGQETSGVDLLLSPKAELYGRVTYETTGLPAHPLQVCLTSAGPGLPGIDFKTETAVDGTYSLDLEVAEGGSYEIFWYYKVLSGFSRPRFDSVVGTVHINPGDKMKFDFTASAAVTVPAKCVDKEGKPVTGINVGIRKGGPYWDFGMGPVDAEGRILIEGLPPDVHYRLVAEDRPRHKVGISEPFVGQPGETLPEMLIVCTVSQQELGGIRGILSDAAGDPIANATLKRSDENRSLTTNTDADGIFLFSGLTPQEYQSIHFKCWRGLQLIEHEEWEGTVENVEIVAGEITDLGTITLDSIPNKWRDTGLEAQIGGELTPEVEAMLERMLDEASEKEE